MNDAEPDDGGGLIPITLGEARRLFTALTATASRTVERAAGPRRGRPYAGCTDITFGLLEIARYCAMHGT